MTRLIDADALNEHKFVGDKFIQLGGRTNGKTLEAVNRAYQQGWNDAIDAITVNAPTVEPCYQTTSCLDCKMYDKENHHCPRFCEVIRELVKEGEERPQGEWKETRYETPIGIIYRQTQCSNCGWKYELPMWFNFCPTCGADMRKETENEDNDRN